MSQLCDKCGNPLNNAFSGRAHYCFTAVRQEIERGIALGEEQENNEGSAGETPDPHDPTQENDDGINEEDNAA